MLTYVCLSDPDPTQRALGERLGDAFSMIPPFAFQRGLQGVLGLTLANDDVQWAHTFAARAVTTPLAGCAAVAGLCALVVHWQARDRRLTAPRSATDLRGIEVREAAVSENGP